MKTTETEHREIKAEPETLIIAKNGDGFRVCSPLTPAKQYVVSGVPDDPHCTCPDFTHSDRNPDWRCKHILAVLNEVGEAIPIRKNPTPAPPPNGVGNEPPPGPQKKMQNGRNGKGAVMILKRSVSPDGRIDALSVEFSCPVGSITTGDIKQQAEKILVLQGEIAAGFLKANGNGNGGAKNPENDNGAAEGVPGQLLGVASMNSKWGRRLFINVLVNDRVLKFFGSEKQLSEAVTAAGFPNLANQATEGATLNLPCQVVTKPSPDGKYLNIDRVLRARAPAKG